jgi:PhzF family phenazine biosynthesis protein
MGQIIVQIDAFTDTPFRGNPAAVCLLPDFPADERLQRIASEMNLSETAFLRRRDDGFDLRWFTPALEVDLCGHATLASAHFLWNEGELRKDQEARFHTRSGWLTARLVDGWIEMDFPSEPPQAVDGPAGLAEALTIEPRYVGRNRFDYLVEIESEAMLRQLDPDLGLLKSLSARGFSVTSPSSSADFDFVSRFFAPASGIDEDPVTGSAHCCLAPYWGAKLDRTEMVAYQASARGGVVKVKLAGDRVQLSGQAVTVLRGELLA